MTLADLIVSLRTLANDTATSNLVRQETPTGAVDSSNTKYRVQNVNIVAGSVYMTVGSSFRSQTGFTVDSANGIIAYTVAPTAGSKPFEADYCFNWFVDSDHTQFLNRGADALGYYTSGAPDPAAVPAGLTSALIHYALHHFWERRASQYANKYNSTGGMAGQSVEVVTKAFKALSDTAMADAIKFRDDYYNKQGRKGNPASGVTSYKIDPYTPKR